MILSIVGLLLGTVTGFSRFYGRCAVHVRGLEVSRDPYEKVQVFGSAIATYRRVPERQLEYSKHHLITHKYVGSGSSAHVFVVEDLVSRQLLIAKQYLIQEDHREEHHITHLMGMDTRWTKDAANRTIALQPYLQAQSWKLTKLRSQQFRTVLYKIIYQLSRLHRLGWMHRDIKPLNIIVQAIDTNHTFKREVRLIDWNGAQQYYLGAKYLDRFGTKCYMAPELLLGLKHYTPAMDVWSIGIAAYYHFFGMKPVKKSCSKQPFQAVIEFVGFMSVLEMYLKYQPQTDLDVIDQLMQMRHKKGTIQLHLSSAKGELPSTAALKKLLRRMLEVDPERRATLPQLLQDPYFRQLTEMTAIQSQQDSSD